jgi:hypothetical protein
MFVYGQGAMVIYVMDYVVKGMQLRVRVKDRYTAEELVMLVDVAHAVETGEGVFEPDHELALALYSLCAAHGDAVAMNNYGWMALNGMGMAKDTDTAIKALEGAASRGLTLAMVNIGNIYENADDYVEASFGKYRKDGNAFRLVKGYFNHPASSRHFQYDIAL